MISVIKPVGSTIKGVGSWNRIAPGFRKDTDVTLAILDNGKLNANRLLECVVDNLADNLDITKVLSFRKPSVSVPPDPEDIAEIKRQADGVITGIGD